MIKEIKIHRVFFVAWMVLFLSGCAGLAAGTYGKKELASTNFRLIKERNQFFYGKQKSLYTENEVVEYWGQPDSIDEFEDCKVLIYKDGTSWSGVGAFVGVVPVPLLVPTGTYKNRIYVHQDLAVGLIQEYGEVNRAVGYMCGSNECASSAGEKVNEPEVNAKEALKEWCTKSIK